MNLNVKDRICLLQLLPTQASFEHLLLCKDIQSKVDFSKEEREEFDFKSQNNQLVWKNEKDKEIEFSSSEKDYLKNLINEKSSKKELMLEMLDTYQKLKA